MGGYYIEGDEKKYNTPFIACEEMSDLRSLSPLVVEADYSGTTSNPKKFYEANGGYLAGSQLGSSKSMSYQRMSGGTGLQVGANYYVIIAFSLPGVGNTYYYRVLFVASSDGNVRDAIEYVIEERWTSDNILYNGSGSSEIPPFVEYLNEWDEQPTEDPEGDPDNLDARGGEFADLENFRTNNPIAWSDWLTDPAYFDPYDFDEETHSYRIGMMTPLYLTDEQLRNFGRALWNDANDNFIGRLGSFLNGRVDPNAAGIMSLFSVPALPTSGDVVDVYLYGNQVGTADLYSTAQHFNRYKSWYIGSLSVKEAWGSAKDYLNTDVSIYLPFVGIKELNPQHVIGKKITLLAKLDFWTGDLLYIIFSEGDQYFPQSTPIYQFSTNCAQNLPYSTGNDKNLRDSVYNTAGAMASIATGLGMMMASPASGGATLALAGAGIKAAQTIGSDLETGKMGFNAGGGGSLNGNTGAMGSPSAFLILSRSVPVYPNGWREEIGAPRYQKLPLLGLHGFTVFADIKLDGLAGATGDEVAQLERDLMTEGIII